MILADKIIRLRRKMGWSQEELAEKMNVSRQAVSKWESAQSIPDIGKILLISELFGVTTDYLLKDEIETEEHAGKDVASAVRRITMEEAIAYLDFRRRASWRIALATLLCILSPLALILLGAASELSNSTVSETMAGAVGMLVLFALVTCAVSIYIFCGFQNDSYAFLDQRIPFETEYGVEGTVRQQKKKFRQTYVRANVIATALCIVSPVPLILSSFGGNEMLHVLMLALMFLLVGSGVFTFIVVGVRWESMRRLLREGEYGDSKKDAG